MCWKTLFFRTVLFTLILFVPPSFYECESVMHASTCLSSITCLWLPSHADFSIKQQKPAVNFMHLIPNTHTHTSFTSLNWQVCVWQKLNQNVFSLVSIGAKRKVKMFCLILKSLLFMHYKLFANQFWSGYLVFAQRCIWRISIAGKRERDWASILCL